MDVWTRVPKPTSSIWTNIPKPAESSVMVASQDAEPFGLLMAITSILGGNTPSLITGWANIPKPTSSVWTFVAKPTQ